MKCPLKSGLYEKLDLRVNHKAMMLQSDSQQSPSSHNQPCKYLTQTQTLHVGCQSDQQYSLRTKLCYPNHQNKNENPIKPMELPVSQSNTYAYSDSSKISTTAYTQLESEINLVCLAHWKHDENHVIVSRSMSNEILCSVRFFFFFEIKFI